MKRYIINVLIGIDQLFNAIFGGDPDETISSRIGRVKIAHNGKVPKTKPLEWLIDTLLERIDKDHCIEAIEKKEVYNARRH